MVNLCLFWSSAFLLVELLLSSESSKILPASLGLIIMVSVLTLEAGFELLALTVLVTYCATVVFLFIVMLTIEGVNSLGSSSFSWVSKSSSSLVLLFFCCLLFCLAGWGSASLVDYRLVSWVDVLGSFWSNTSTFFSLSHILLTSFFLTEAFLLNIWILILLAISVLSLSVSVDHNVNVNSHVAANSNVRSSWGRSSTSRVSS